MNYPPDNFTAETIGKVREWYNTPPPDGLGEVADDRALAVWVCGSSGWVSLWLSDSFLGDAPEQRMRNLWELLRRRILDTKFPPPVPPTPEPGPLAPIILGRWQGNFLYPGEPFFFGPACAGWDAPRRADYFAAIKRRGDTHVLINAEQDDWGPRKGQPQWTSGGFSAYQGDGMARFVAILIDARRAGLIPVVGVVDQPSLRAHSLDTLIARSVALVNATANHACLYMLSWEIEEVWSNGDVREPNLKRWIREVDWRGRDVGIHFAAGVLSGGMNFYGEMPPFVTRLYQWQTSASDGTLAEEARLIADVAKRTNTKVCAFEQSSSLNMSPAATEAECIRRARIIRREFEAIGLRPEQMGSLNG